MVRKLLCMALLAMMVTVVGCGGGGSSISPFAGTWIGPWTDAGNSQTGTLNITGSNSGALTGSIQNTTTGQNGTVTGNITNGGDVSGTYVYPGTTYTASGTVAIGANGHLTGTVQTFQGGTLIGTTTFDLVKQ